MRHSFPAVFQCCYNFTSQVLVKSGEAEHHVDSSWCRPNCKTEKHFAAKKLPENSPYFHSFGFFVAEPTNKISGTLLASANHRVTRRPFYFITLTISNRNIARVRITYLPVPAKWFAVANLYSVTSVTRTSNFSLLLLSMTLQNRNQIATFWTPFDGGCFAQATAVRRSKQISVILLCDCSDYLRIVGRLRLLRPDKRKHACCPQR